MMGHAGKASVVGILYFIFLVAVPLGFVTILSSYIGAAGGDPSRYFHGTALYILLLGTGTAILASLGAYYEKGSGKRLAFALGSSVFLALWGYFFIGSMSIYYMGDTYAYEVFVPGIAVVLALSLSFKIVYRIVEYYVYKDEYREGNAPPPDEYYEEEYAYPVDDGMREHQPRNEGEEEMYF